MDEFLDDMDDEQVDDLLMPEEDETSSNQMYEHFRFVADKNSSIPLKPVFYITIQWFYRNTIQSQ